MRYSTPTKRWGIGLMRKRFKFRGMRKPNWFPLKNQPTAFEYCNARFRSFESPHNACQDHKPNDT